MKNLPEDELWKKVSRRLSNYTESPDLEWSDIASKIPKHNHNVVRVNRSSDLMVAVLLAFFLGYGWGSQRENERIGKVALTDGRAGAPTMADTREAATKPIESSNANSLVHRMPVVQSSSDVKAAEGSQPSEVPALRVMPSFTHRDTVGDRSRRSIASNLSSAAASKLDSTTNRSLETVVIVQKDSVASKGEDVATIIKPIVKKKRRMPVIFAAVTPSLAYQKITPFKNDNVNIQGLHSAPIVGAERFGFSAEVGIQMPITKKLEFASSLTYYRQDATVSYTYSSDELAVDEHSDDWSFSLSPESNTTRFSYRMRNVGLAVGLFYHLHGHTLMHKPGLSLYYQTGRDVGSAEYANRGSSYFGYQLHYRLEFVMNERSSFYLQPSFAYTLKSKENLDQPFAITPYRAGVGIGWMYHF